MTIKTNQTTRLRLGIFCLFLSISFSSFAQGDGPRTALLAPTGVFGIATKYVNLSQNLSPSTILVKEADFEIQLFPVSAFYTFKLNNRFAQLIAVATPSKSSLTLSGTAPGIPTDFSAKGLADGFIGLKVGMVGAPALSVAEFTQRTPSFSMYSYLRLWYSGKYSNQEILNLGSNRMTIHYSMPMSFPLSKNVERMTWLELAPSIRFFTANDEPQLISEKNKIQQKPLFQLEAHLSHSFSKKFWIAANFGYRLGGKTEVDGFLNDNRINLLGASASFGYKILPFLNFTADYGKRIWGDNGADSRMLRMGLVFTYVNLEKQGLK